MLWVYFKTEKEEVFRLQALETKGLLYCKEYSADNVKVVSAVAAAAVAVVAAAMFSDSRSFADLASERNNLCMQEGEGRGGRQIYQQSKETTNKKKKSRVFRVEKKLLYELLLVQGRGGVGCYVFRLKKCQEDRAVIDATCYRLQSKEKI